MDRVSREYLNNLGIYELRSVARSVGVKSPTTKKRDELIESIIKIQTGEQEAISSNKGRKPKNFKAMIPNEIKIMCDKEQKNNLFEYAKEESSNLVFNDDFICDCINKTKINCFGVVREESGKKYLYNYNSSINYISIDDDLALRNNICLGDFIVGVAEQVSACIGRLISIEFLNFSNYEKQQLKNENEFVLLNDANKNEINHEFEKYDDYVNLFVEIEANALDIKNISKNFYYVQTGEAESINKSVNCIIDLSKILNVLNQKSIKFNIVIYDIDYIYSILNVYNTSKGGSNDIDAGQCLKQIFTLIKSNNCNKCLIIERGNYKRNIYLDSIINKYI